MAQISLRIEDDVKKKAEQACADIGMSLSTAYKYLPKKVRQGEGRIDDANRIVYRMEDNMIKIVQCGFHYRDK